MSAFDVSVATWSECVCLTARLDELLYIRTHLQCHGLKTVQRPHAALTTTRVSKNSADSQHTAILSE